MVGKGRKEVVRVIQPSVGKRLLQLSLASGMMSFTIELSIYPILFAHSPDDPHLSGFLSIFFISCSCQERVTYFDLFLWFVPRIVVQRHIQISSYKVDRNQIITRMHVEYTIFVENNLKLLHFKWFRKRLIWSFIFPKAWSNYVSEFELS